MKKLLGTMFMLMLLVSVGFGGMVYTNQVPMTDEAVILDNALSLDNGSMECRSADDFVLTTNATITGLEFLAIDQTNPAFTDWTGVTVEIYEGVTKPDDSPLYTQYVVWGDITSSYVTFMTDPHGGEVFWIYHLEALDVIPGGFDLVAGIKYWLCVQADVTSNGERGLAAVQNNVDAEVHFKSDDLGFPNWVPGDGNSHTEPMDLAFNLFTADTAIEEATWGQIKAEL